MEETFQRPADDEALLDEVFDLAVRARRSGEPLDVDRLLSGRGHLRESAEEVLRLARDVARDGPAPHPPGELPVLGGYTILEEAGRGGIGIVYRARQDDLGRIVAVKVLAPSLLPSARSRGRFVLEARALAKLRHPAIVAVHDVIDRGDLCAYAMEWVDGTTLAKAIASKDPRLDMPGIARLGVTIASALSAVHDAGMVHRDVKPSNILLRQDGTPLLSDFSLVQDPEQTMHTATGDFVGTMAYAAPEQLRGEAGRIGPWTDVYELGVTLYAALTGANPFVSTSTAEMLRKIEGGLTPQARKLNPLVPLDLAIIVAKAMDPDPARRYSNGGELEEDLARFLRFEPIRARPAGLALRLHRWVGRSPALAAVLIALVLTLSIGLAVALELGANLRLERDGARRAESKAQDEAEIQSGVTHFMRNVFSHGDASKGSGRADRTIREALDLASADLLSPTKSYRPEVGSAIRLAVADCYLSIGSVVSAAPHLTEARNLALSAYGPDSREVAEASHQLGRVHRLLGRWEEGERCLREALRIRLRLAGPDSPWVAQSLQSLGILFRHQGKYDEAETAYRDALETYRRAFKGEDEENVAVVLNALATLQTLTGRYAEAEAHVRRSLEILDGIHQGRPHVDISNATFNLGHIQWSTGRREEGERTMRDALAATRSLVGKGDKQIADHASKLASHLRERGGLAEAEVLLRESLSAYESLGLARDAGERMIDLADLVLEAGRPSEAEELLSSLLDRTENRESHPQALRIRGAARTRLSRFEEAECDLRAAWSAARTPSGTGPDRKAAATALIALYEAWSAAGGGDRVSASVEEWRRTLEGVETAEAH